MGERLVHIHEVFRDCIQAVPDYIALETKLDYISRITQAIKPGARCTIEVTAFVHPKAIPQHADAAEVIRGLQHQENITHSVLVPNRRGFETAMEADGGRGVIGEFAGFTAATDEFLFHNLNTTPQKSLAELAKLNAACQEAGIPFVAYISCMAICPYEGIVHPEKL